jgi:uncharacterized protein involved in response to NO
MTNHNESQGPVLFSSGFRPFFLAAILFALIVIPLWWMVWQGRVSLPGHFSATDWHIHEMIFGYGAAVVTGFLFTAIPNWTGRLPTRGAPLVYLLMLWVIGRIASAGLLEISPIGTAVVDQLFPLAVVAMVAREILAGRNWRNLKVLGAISVLMIANALFHYEAILGVTDISRRLGISVLVFLIMLIGGRITPSFTRNWLVLHDRTKLPAPFDRLDIVALGLGFAALVAWTLAPGGLVCAIVSLLAALAHLLRLGRWRGLSVLASPLLFMLHAAYFMLPVGLLALSAEGWLGSAPDIGAHLLGIGAIAGMTVAVMVRATKGHTGRRLEADPALTLAFVLVIAAALLRAARAFFEDAGEGAVALSAALWVIAFGLLLIRIGPWLLAPKQAPRRPGGINRSRNDEEER